MRENACWRWNKNNLLTGLSPGRVSRGRLSSGRSGAAGLLALAALVATPAGADQRPINPVLAHLARDRWVEIHRQHPHDEVVFVRQTHAGSAFDTRRGRIVVFGSDTHGRDWTNAPLFFDIASLKWSRAYPNDAPSTYRVSSDGFPVAGIDGSRPWAMHTFAAVTYDSLNDRLVVASYPQHLEPGRFTKAMAHMWPGIRRHPTWFFDLGSQRWRALQAVGVDFFAYATVYDSHRAVVIGYRPDGIYELPMSEANPEWRRAAQASHSGYHTSAVYDSLRRLVIVAGSHRLSNEVIVYDPASRRDRVMPTPGLRPPAFQHAPMAFHERKGVTVALVDRAFDASGTRHGERNRTGTWLYDTAADMWLRAAGAALPFSVGMNYNMHYDRLHDVLLLVAVEPKRPTSVWALKLR
jgi:hypothetical protein